MFPKAITVFSGANIHAPLLWPVMAPSSPANEHNSCELWSLGSHKAQGTPQKRPLWHHKLLKRKTEKTLGKLCNLFDYFLSYLAAHLKSISVACGLACCTCPTIDSNL